MKIRSLLELYELLPKEERLIVDVLREVIKAQLPSHCKERYLTMFPSSMEIKASAWYGLPPFPGAE